ncbi:DIP1984 family protein [Paenibacillus sp. CN-4]|uniref:DIP1984 family protein n=1 Tax=Paenibacillus nanchangensis TaxID=3348343 RepID=UPI00397CE0DB
MKLAEALVLRADTQKRVAQIGQRLGRVVKVQEGEQPAEDPMGLMAELETALDELAGWVRRINRTNASTPFDSEWSLSDALAERDKLMQKRKMLTDLLDQAAIKQDRYTRSEVRYTRTIEVAVIQRQIDDLSKAYRELDFKIQEKNWLTELTE